MELKITSLTRTALLQILTASAVGILFLGVFMMNIHHILPKYFPEKAAFPFPDAFVAILSITANLLMTIKKRECWILWVIVDAVSVLLYFLKGIYLVGIEYIIFGLIAYFGYINWTREEKSTIKQTGAEI